VAFGWVKNCAVGLTCGCDADKSAAQQPVLGVSFFALKLRVLTKMQIGQFVAVMIHHLR
jgi:hypothetical protein